MCIFCEIIAGNIPSAKVYEDDKVYAFRDINPQAPVHVLVVPKQHIPSADAIDADNAAVVASIFAAIPKIAAQEDSRTATASSLTAVKTAVRAFSTCISIFSAAKSSPRKWHDRKNGKIFPLLPS